MYVIFEDENGRTGEVTDDLDLEYDGRWEDELEDRLEYVEGRCDDDGEASDQVVRELVLELPEAPHVVRAERRSE